MIAYCVLFPAFSDGLREPDPQFYRETQALEALGIPWRVVNIDALIRGDMERALRFFGEAPPQPVLYRGWILHPEEYTELVEALKHRGCQVFTSPENYRRTLLFPEFFPAIADHSFPAVWIEGTDVPQAVKAAKQLGPPPYFIKDFAKSAKEIWPSGCVVASEEAFATAIESLVHYRGDRFETGIVIRPMLQLRYLDEHPFGGKIHEEYRLFFFRGKMISRTPYDRVGGDAKALPDYSFLPQRIPSEFFTADVVVTEEGQALLLEVGDGGTSALPPDVSPLQFHSAILEVLGSSHTARDNHSEN